MDGEKVCGQCANYLGGGDWGLCCQKKHGLTNEDTGVADCPHFEQAAECRNVTMRVGMFRCSLCNWYGREDAVGGACPGCGETVTGAIWYAQKHFRG